MSLTGRPRTEPVASRFLSATNAIQGLRLDAPAAQTRWQPVGSGTVPA